MKPTRFISPRTVSAHYFRPGAYADAFALVLKPREIMPSGTDGRPEVLCTAAIFDTEDALDAGRPTKILRDTIVNVGLIYRQLIRTYDQDGVLAGYIGQGDKTSYGTRPWLIKNLDPETQEQVEGIWNNLMVTA